jgi:hypothetical protein
MTVTPADPRDWPQVRLAAIDAVTALTGDPHAATPIADAVLAVCGEEAVNRMATEIASTARLKSIGFRDGMHIELEPARELVAAWAAAARTILADAGAPNYAEIEMGFSLAGDPARYAFILQRCGKLTPHQARAQAEERAAAAEAERDQLRAELGRFSRPASDDQQG